MTAALLCLTLGAAKSLSARPAGAPVAPPAGRPDPVAMVDAAVAARNPDRLRSAARWFDRWRARQRSSRLAAAAIRLAAACREQRACDGYYPLRYARAAAHSAGPEVRTALAREFLGIDLPWYALEVLGPQRTGPSEAVESALRQRARAAGAIIVQDAGIAAPRPVIEGIRGRVAERLWLLFGIPAIEATGSYLSPEFHYAPRTSATSEAEFAADYRMSRLAWRSSHSMRPTLTALFNRAYRPDIERLYDLQPPARAAGAPLAISSTTLAGWIRTAESGSSDAAAGARASLSFMLTGLRAPSTDIGSSEAGVEQEPERLDFVGGLGLGGAWLLSATDTWGTTEYFAIVPRDGRLLGYALGAGQSARIDELDGLPGAEVVLTGSEGSGGFFSASVFSPAAARISLLADGLYRGDFAFVELDGDPAREVVVSQALSMDGRFADCNQCPKRRSAYILDFDEQTRRYRAVGAAMTATEDAANAARNLTGMTPTMLAGLSAQEAEAALRRLVGGNGPAVSAEDLNLVLGQSVAYIDAANYSGALRYAGAAARRLEPYSRSSQGRPYLDAQTMAGFAEVQAGNPLATIARLRRIPAEVVGRRREGAQTYWSLMAVAAMTLGDATVAYDAMQREQGYAAADNRSPGQGNLSMLFSHFGAWRAAREQTIAAIDTSLREENYRGLTLMMINAAEAERRSGDLGSALDWLARALRWTRSMPDSGNSAYALQVAVAIALDARLPDLAVALLDVSLLSHSAQTWHVRGPDHLLLYGRAFEQKGQLDQATRSLAAAARLAELRPGLRSVEAWAEVGRLALQRDDEAGARDAYRRAFARIAEGRRTTPTDTFKIGYLQNVDTIAERHFALSSGVTAADIRQQAADLEAWKFQVFKDRYSTEGGVDADVVQSLQGRLRDNEAYVSYFVSDSVSFAMVVTRDGVRRRDLAVTATRARHLRSEILAFMDLGNPTSAAYIRDRRMPRRLHRLLQQVREELIEPLGLGGGIDTLLLNEDEDLAGIPWPAVPPGGDSWIDSIRWALGFPRVRSLLERYRVAMVPTARMVLRDSAPRAAAQRVVVAAALGPIRAATVGRALGVASREDRYASLPPLREGLSEAEAVRTAFNGSPALLLDRYAADAMRVWAPVLGREPLRRTLAGATVWHFVGHGVFNRVDPMGSAIFLGDDGNPEWVSASDLAGWDLRRVTFVALSACETGTTRPEVGGETFGMLRGLLGAGVHTAMVMGWPVDDRAASVFYQSFYGRFGSETRGDAHRHAVLEAKDAFTHPFYWSPAALYGDWR